MGCDSGESGLIGCTCGLWNDCENDCETAQRFGDDPELELVAAGVILRMTDLLVSCAGLVRPQLPAPARSKLLA